MQIFTAEQYCQVTPPSARHYDSLWTSIAEIDSVFSPAVRQRFSQRARSVAADVGLLPLLDAFVGTEKQLQRRYTDADQLAMNTIRQQINDRITLAALEVTSVMAEIECEQDRAIELQNYLQLQTGKRSRRLTISSILASAFFTAFVSALSLGGAEAAYVEGASVTGAALSGYWAFRSLSDGKSSFMFKHTRNHLTEIRSNPTVSQVYPPMVWHFLTREYEFRQQTPTVREIILDRWRELDLLTEVDSEEEKKRVDLLFGEGGLYNLDEISHRISLIDLLETEVGLMNQEVKQLQQELLIHQRVRNR